jgi:hypothetical protein
MASELAPIELERPTLNLGMRVLAVIVLAPGAVDRETTMKSRE